MKDAHIFCTLFLILNVASNIKFASDERNDGNVLQHIVTNIGHHMIETFLAIIRSSIIPTDAQPFSSRQTESSRSLIGAVLEWIIVLGLQIIVTAK